MKKEVHPFFHITGILVVIPTICNVAWRIYYDLILVWEKGAETYWVGEVLFMLPLIIVMYLGILWLVFVFALMISQKTLGDGLLKSLVVVYVLGLTFASTPSTTWYYLFAAQHAKGPHAQSFIDKALYRNDVRLLKSLHESGASLDQYNFSFELDWYLERNRYEILGYLICNGVQLLDDKVTREKIRIGAEASNEKDILKIIQTYETGENLKPSPVCSEY